VLFNFDLITGSVDLVRQSITDVEEGDGDIIEWEQGPRTVSEPTGRIPFSIGDFDFETLSSDLRVWATKPITCFITGALRFVSRESEPRTLVLSEMQVSSSSFPRKACKACSRVRCSGRALYSRHNPEDIATRMLCRKIKSDT
jgi:hypothetical protein